MEFKLPDIGEGLTQGEVTKWLVREGDAVKENQPMVEVMTDKATVEITSPRTGRIAKIRVAEGQTVPIGTVLVTIEESAGAPAAAPTPAHAGHVQAPRPAVSEAPQAPSRTAAANGGRVLATPSTRLKARQLGVDLQQLAGSGPRGRVTKDDVVRAAAGVAAPVPAPPRPERAPAPLPGRVEGSPSVSPAPAGGPTFSERLRTVAPAPAAGALEERIPLKGLRKRIAEHLVHSKHTAPHYTYVEELDATELVALRQQAKAVGEKRGVKLTYLPFIIKALIAGFREFPLLNSSLDDARGEIVLKRYYNIGIATASPDGLMVPVVKGCERRSILDLAAEIQRVTDAARSGKIALDDVRDSTFTITSAGNLGGVLATPIINHPDVAILGVHKIKETPVVRNGQIVIRQMCYLSLSLDHRVVDGAVAAEFMNAVVRVLQDPKLLLLEQL